MSDNGAMLHMKSRNNANSPHSPAVTMTTEPPEVGGKSQEMEEGGGRTRGMHVSCFFSSHKPISLAGSLYIHTQDHSKAVVCWHPASRGMWRGEAQFKRQPRGLENRKNSISMQRPLPPSCTAVCLIIYLFEASVLPGCSPPALDCPAHSHICRT